MSNTETDQEARRMTGAPDPNDVLFPPTVPTATFPEKGTSWTGTVLSMESMQQTEVGSGRPLFWDDGRPRLQVAVTIQTDTIDPDVEDDDGRRRLFVKGDMMQAVRQAVKKAGRKAIQPGDQLTVTYVEDGVAPAKGLSKPKMYEADYVPVEVPFPED